MLKHKFERLTKPFSNDTNLIEKLYQEIHLEHSQKGRYYHTLTHLEEIYKVLETSYLTPVIEFAIFYHDSVYDIQKDNNEEASALLAQKRLTQLNVPQEIIQDVYDLILATKTHQSQNRQADYFLDADMAILGSSPDNYQRYTHAIRKEYALYADECYTKGRLKVLKSFLAKPNIYLSPSFQKSHQTQAYRNLEWEMHSLQA